MTKSAAGTTGATYAGLDVSLKETAVCIVDEAGKIMFERMVPTDPRLIAECLAKHAPGLERFGLEERRHVGLAVARVPRTRTSRRLSRQPPRPSRPVDEAQQERPQRCARPRRPRAHGLVPRGARPLDRCPVHPVDAAVPPAAAAIAARDREPDPRCPEDARRDDRLDQRPWVHAARRRAACRQRLARSDPRSADRRARRDREAAEDGVGKRARGRARGCRRAPHDDRARHRRHDRARIQGRHRRSEALHLVDEGRPLSRA